MSQHSGAAFATSSPVADSGTITAGGVLILFVILGFGISSFHHCLDYYIDRRRGGTAVGNDGAGITRDGADPEPHRSLPVTAVYLATMAPFGNDGDGTAVTRRGGVDPKLLRSLPVTVYRAAAKDDDSTPAAAGCAVCLAELEDGEEARFLPRCGHGFHAECVDTWLASHTTCPLCRLHVAEPDDVPPPPALALRPVPRELANYDNYATTNLPAASVLRLGVPGDHQQDAVTPTAPSTDNTSTVPTVAIEIPESAAPTTTCDLAKSLDSASARLTTIRRLWSF